MIILGGRIVLFEKPLIFFAIKLVAACVDNVSSNNRALAKCDLKRKRRISDALSSMAV